METPDLFAVGRKKPRAPRPKSPHAKDIQRIMLQVYFPLYCALYHNEKPLIQAKHWSMLRSLVDRYGPDLVEERLRAFFASQDPWIRRSSGHTMGAFVSQWQKLAAVEKEKVAMPNSRAVVDAMRASLHTTPTSSGSSRTTSRPSDPF